MVAVIEPAVRGSGANQTGNSRYDSNEPGEPTAGCRVLFLSQFIKKSLMVRETGTGAQHTEEKP